LIVYSNTKCPNTNCSYFYDFLGAILWALINQGSKFHSKKSWQAHASASAANIKKITADPTPNNGDPGSLTIVARDTSPLVSVSRRPVCGLLKISHLYLL
jgi:hypothetical protein